MIAMQTNLSEAFAAKRLPSTILCVLQFFTHPLTKSKI